jgi:hypothetical protein
MGYPYQVLAFQKYSVLSPASEESVYASRKGKNIGEDSRYTVFNKILNAMFLSQYSI